MERSGGQTIPLAISTELTPRLAAVCHQIQWVVAGTNAPADLLAWQGAIHTLQAWNLPLTFVFMATGLVGIAFLLWGIITTIQRRGNVSARVFPTLREHSH